MANWCEGTLKIRGAKKHLLDFLNNGIEQCEGFKIEDYGEGMYLQIPDNTYIKGTSRAFIMPCDVYMDTDHIIVFDAMQAWSFKTEEWQAISEKYHIDIRLYGFEQGMEFNKEIEILNGKVTINNVIEFNDYRWECISPNIGG